MSQLTPEQVEDLLGPYLSDKVYDHLYQQIVLYLELLLRWNARTNLTSIRDPREIVQRHFGESLFASQHVLRGTRTLLDFGSGAGLPGVPIQLLRPDLQVTLAESQQKKCSFLRELIRILRLPTELWPFRVGALPDSKTFDTVTLRAVDRMPQALREASTRANLSILLLTTRQPASSLPGFKLQQEIIIPNSSHRTLQVLLRPCE